MHYFRFFQLKASFIASCFISCFPLSAHQYIVNNVQDSGPGSLRQALLTVQSNDKVVFNNDVKGTIYLNSMLPIITENVSIVGNSKVTIDGQNKHQVFLVASTGVSISDLKVSQGASYGGNGGSSFSGTGGGGLGAGGALSVNTNASVTINNVSFEKNKAEGGKATVTPNIYYVSTGGGGGGGCTIGSDGGNGGYNYVNGSGGGGGGGCGAAGGNALSTGGGAGGGFTGTINGSSLDGDGSNGGVATGGNGGGGIAGPGTGGQGGTPNTDGAPGSTVVGGGGGGGGGTLISADDGGNGGSGGSLGGGGGGGSGSLGGSGGAGHDFSGGGGSGGSLGDGSTATAGSGGFGGGGGGGGSGGEGYSGSSGGSGGFGSGGGGGGTNARGGKGGVGGGKGGSNRGGGGGGAGMGGAVFVREGGSLIIEESSFLENSAIGGKASGAENKGSNGSGLGQDLYVMENSSMTYANKSPNTITSLCIEGEGSLIIDTPGKLVLNRTSGEENSLKTSINQGTVALNDAKLGTTTVASQGILKGNGSAGKVTNRGIISPGNSIGTLVFEELVQTPSSTIQIEINGSGESSLVQVTKTAILDGTLKILPHFEPYLKGTTYTVLTSGEGNSGTFNSFVIQGLDDLNLDLLYFPNSVQLLVKQNFFNTFQDDLTGNPRIVSQYLEEITINQGSDLASVLSELTPLNQNQLSEALDQLHPALFSALAWSNATMMADVNSQLLKRINFLCHPACENTCTPSKGLWAYGFGDQVDQKKSGNLKGFQANTGGIAAGWDCLLPYCLLVGVTGGYSHIHLKWDNSTGKSDIDNAFVGVYAARCGECYTIDASALINFPEFKSERHIEFGSLNRKAKSDCTGNALLGHLGATLNFSLLSINLQPFAGVDYIYFHQKDFSEKNADSLNLHVQSTDASMLRTELGLMISRCFCTSLIRFAPKAYLSWIYYKPLSGKNITASLAGYTDTFTVDSTGNCINEISPGIGLDFFITNCFTIGIAYDAELAEKRNKHKVGLNVNYQF